MTFIGKQEKVTESVVEARQPDPYQKAGKNDSSSRQKLDGLTFIKKQEKVTDTTVEAKQPDFYQKAGKSD